MREINCTTSTPRTNTVTEMSIGCDDARQLMRSQRGLSRGRDTCAESKLKKGMLEQVWIEGELTDRP